MVDLKDIVVIGLDLSLNSAGMVTLAVKDGKVGRMKYVTAIKKFTEIKIEDNLNIIYGYLSPRVTKTKKRLAENKELFDGRRRSFMIEEVLSRIDTVRAGKFVLVCLEGYAVDSKSTGLLEMAEISGSVRNYCWDKSIYLRVHEPMRVKLWATGGAYAKKMHMVNAARREGLKIPQELLGQGDKFQHETVIDGHCHTHDYAGPGTDLADAFHLANMGRYEILVRRGLVRLDDLSEGQRRVILSTPTKAHPENLLDRPFIVNRACCDLIGDGNGTAEGSSKESNQAR